jgi:ATP-dependent Clp protease ATP-binding subunit ClpC
LAIAAPAACPGLSTTTALTSWPRCSSATPTTPPLRLLELSSELADGRFVETVVAPDLPSLDVGPWILIERHALVPDSGGPGRHRGGLGLEYAVRARAGIKDPRRPIGSFMFMGPTGVGKTELAKQLAAQMFGSQDAIIQIDMSEYMEKFTASRLIGSPPGYVGHEEGGQLSEAVRRRPYAVVLFDEVEKAHPDVMHLLLQILEEGKITDSLGRKIDFRNTIVILTSNIGAELMKRQGVMGFGANQRDDSKYDVMKEKILEEAKKVLKPEFINRLDDLIVFRPLAKPELFRIVDLEISKVVDRIKAKEITIELEESAKAFLAEKGYDPDYGARPMRRAVERYLEDPMAEELLRGNIKSGDTLKVSAVDGKLAFATAEGAAPGEAAAASGVA